MKLKLQYFGQLRRRVDSLEKKTELNWQVVFLKASFFFYSSPSPHFFAIFISACLCFQMIFCLSLLLFFSFSSVSLSTLETTAFILFLLSHGIFHGEAICGWTSVCWGISGWMASQVVLVIKKLPAVCLQCGRAGSIPRWGKSPGTGDGNPIQYFCLENPITEELGWL